MNETGLITHRFTTQDNVLPVLRPAANVQLTRLFQVQGKPGESPSWLVWYEGGAALSVADAASWTHGATDLESIAFALKRDVRNPAHRDDEIGWLYVVHTDVPDDVAPEYNDWYDAEHLPRLARVPGIVRARRFVAPDARPRYFTAYDLADRDAFTSPQGLKARKTPWTERMRNLFSNTRRFTGQLVAIDSGG